MFENKITFDSFIRNLAGLGIVIGILVLINHLSGVLLPFFLAWLVAYLIYPVVKFFQFKLKMKHRIIAILCTLVLLLIIGCTVFLILIPPMLQGFGKVKDVVDTYFTEGIQASTVPQRLSEFIRENIDLNALNAMLKEENIITSVQGAVPK